MVEQGDGLSWLSNADNGSETSIPLLMAEQSQWL